MTDTLILTIVGPDHPGIVDEVSAAISDNGGNWIESRMGNLAGQFAGILLIECKSNCLSHLEKALKQLEKKGLNIQVVKGAPDQLLPKSANIELEIVGPDHPGIVHDISHFLAQNAINIVEISSWCEEGAMSGGYIFHSKISAEIPQNEQISMVENALDGLARELNVDITLDDLKGTRTRI